MASKRDRFHAFHDNLACCVECGFHSKSTDILGDGCRLSDVSPLVLCPEGHALFPTVCPIEDCLASYEGFHRDRNAIKCSQCDYPVRVFDLPDDEYQLTDEQRELIKCAGCGNNCTNRLFMMPYDDNQDVLGVSCLECGSTFIVYNQEEDVPGINDSDSVERKPETCYRREPIVSAHQIQPLDHIETHSTKLGLPYEHHLVVAYIVPEERKFFAYEYLWRVSFSEYSYDEILKGQSFRYIYNEKACLPEEQQHQLAESRMDEKKYNVIFNNCEKYARWIKTGISETLQPVRAAAAALKPLTRTAGIILMQALTEVAPHSMTTEMLGWGGIGIVSIAWMTYKFFQLKGKKDRGEIFKEDFENELIMEGCKTGGTAIGAAIGGLLTLPLGGVFGFLGSLIGSFLLASVGRSIGNHIVRQRKKKQLKHK